MHIYFSIIIIFRLRTSLQFSFKSSALTFILTKYRMEISGMHNEANAFVIKDAPADQDLSLCEISLEF